MPTLPATSTDRTPLKAETAEESAMTDVTTQTKLESDRTDMALTKIAVMTVIIPQTNLNKEVFLATKDKLPQSPEGQDLLSPAVVTHQFQHSPRVKTNLADLATAHNMNLQTMKTSMNSALSMVLNTLSLNPSQLVRMVTVHSIMMNMN